MLCAFQNKYVGSFASHWIVRPQWAIIFVEEQDGTDRQDEKIL
jgi:hypothetical protein